MSTKKSWVLGFLLAGGLSFAATAPVAMRVEVEPIRQVGDETEVAVVVQVSPEDRLRIGSNAILRIELDGGKVSSGSPMRAVRLEDDGSARVVVEWPPGEHHLQVGIEDPRKEDTGLWVGTVRIPDLSPDQYVDEVNEPKSDPEPESVPEPLPIPNPQNRKQCSTGDRNRRRDRYCRGRRGTSTVAEPPTKKIEPVPVPESEISEPVTPPPIETEDVIDAAVAAVGASTVAEPPTKKIEPEPEPVPEPELQEPVTPPVTEAEVEEEAPLVEPLRAEAQPQAGQPEAIGPPQDAEPGPAILPLSADLAARYEEWGSADSDIREFSMIVTRGREPAMDVGIGNFQLRVGGSRVPIEKLGGAERAPLLLGLAMDVAPDEVEDWSGMRGSLSPIVERAGGDRGRLFVATSEGVGAWDADMDAPGGVTLSQKSDNVARLVIASIERFEGRFGRTFLVVLTDGRNEPAKEEWQAAAEAAGEAGVPILVIALWDEKFNNRTRKSLKKLTDISGGSLFLVQGRAQLESAADRFGRYLDGGYSVRFRSPDGGRQTVTTVSVSASEKDLDVSAPKTIR